MKKGRQTTDYLNDILYAISKLDDFIQGLTYEQFIEDKKHSSLSSEQLRSHR